MIGRRHSRKGIALLLVVVVLAVLSILAVPFAVTMAFEERTARNVAHQVEARTAARTALYQARGRLVFGHASHDPTPGVDGIDELDVGFELPVADWLGGDGSSTGDGLPQFDPFVGVHATAHAVDTSGLVDLNSASLFLLGSLYAPAILAVNLPREAEMIEVDSTSGFPESGELWIQGERIVYAEKSDTQFLGCRRELSSSSPEWRDSILHLAGTPVVPMAAYAMATYPIRDPFRWRPYQTVEELRRLGESNRFALTASDYESLRDSLTVHSDHLDSGIWLEVGCLTNNVSVPSDPRRPSVIRVDGSGYLAPGAIVRIREGDHTEYALYAYEGGNGAVLNRPVSRRFTGGVATVEVLARHPVNLNTASGLVLFSVLHGIKFDGNVVVDADSAAEAARAIQENRPITDLAELGAILQSRPGFSASLVGPILENGQNPMGGPPVRTPRGPQNRFLRVSTAPYSFRSGDTYRIAATGLVGSPAGIEVARYRIVETVRIAPPGLVTDRFETQYDFRRPVELQPAHKLVTWPRKLDRLGTAGISDSGDGSIRLESGRLPRATNFDGTHDGIAVNGPRALIPDMPTVNGGNGVQEMSTGGLGFWFKTLAAGPGRTILVDMADDATSNRFGIALVGNEVVLSIADSCLEPGFVERRVRGLFPPQVWHHIWAGWKSTDVGHLSLLVDGEARDGRQVVRSAGRIASGDLAGTMGAGSLTIPLRQAAPGLLAQGGVVRVGEEVIEYEAISGAVLRVRNGPYPGFAVGRRNRAGTSSVAHAAGEPVVPFGYSVRLSGDLPVGGAHLVGDHPPIGFSHLNVPPPVPGGIPGFLPTDTSVPLVSTSAFPDSGLAVLVQVFPTPAFEAVFYASRSSSQLGGLERGQLGTTALAFTGSAIAMPITVAATDTTDYPDQGQIQVENEWIETLGRERNRYFLINPFSAPASNPQQIAQQIIQVGLPLVQQVLTQQITMQQFQVQFDAAISGLIGRAKDGTIEVAHPDGAAILPVFRVAGADICGRFDRVTFMVGADPASRSEAVVNWAMQDRVALDRFVPQAYARQQTRVLKFPSGELPVVVGPVHFAGADPSSGTSESNRLQIDEILFNPIGRRGNFRLDPAAPLSVNETSTLLLAAPPGTSGIDPAGGAIQVGDELIAFERVQGDSLVGLTRGYLGSRVSVHPAGAPVFNQAHLPITSLAGNLGSADRNVPLGQIDNDRWRQEGYVRVGNELIGYTQRGGGGVIGPPAPDGSGLFRGAFGTPPTSHAAGSPVFDQPFRYFDRFALGSLRPEIARYPLTLYSPGSTWRELRVDVEDHNHRSLRVHALIRFDGTPGWDAPTTRDPRPGQLADIVLDNRPIDLGIHADTLEIRFLYEYDRGAFQDGISWKETPWIRQVEVDRAGPEIVYEHREGR